MAQSSTEILLEAGTNELEIVEFYLEEEPKADEDGELNQEVPPLHQKTDRENPAEKLLRH